MDTTESPGIEEDSGTGPDMISTKVLKNCAASLAHPITMIARAILDTGEWPSGWKFHWVYPLYKRKCKGNPGNYRGIHLTAQVSKVVERTIGELFLPFLEIINAAGPNQFAYRKNRGFRDALAFNLMVWIFLLRTGHKIALYCSDVSGAFDRLSTERLLAKLQYSGVHSKIMEVLQS